MAATPDQTQLISKFLRRAPPVYALTPSRPFCEESDQLGRNRQSTVCDERSEFLKRNRRLNIDLDPNVARQRTKTFDEGSSLLQPSAVIEHRRLRREVLSGQLVSG